MKLTAIDDAAWESPWRRRHVAEKTGLAVALILTALIAPTWPGCLLVALASVALILGSARIPPRTLAFAAAVPAGFLLMSGLAVAVTVGAPSAEAWWALGPLSMGAPGVLRAVDVVAHGIAGTLAVLVLATTTPMVDLLSWLRGLRVPGPLLEIAELTYRLLFILLGTAFGVHEAARARLGDAPGGPGARSRRWRNLAALVGTVALRSWDRAQRLTDGLGLRGFQDQLATLPGRRRVSPRFVLCSVGLIAAIWLTSAVLA